MSYSGRKAIATVIRPNVIPAPWRKIRSSYIICVLAFFVLKQAHFAIHIHKVTRPCRRLDTTFELRFLRLDLVQGLKRSRTWNARWSQREQSKVDMNQRNNEWRIWMSDDQPLSTTVRNWGRIPVVPGLIQRPLEIFSGHQPQISPETD